jgi:hypothetical protein
VKLTDLLNNQQSKQIVVENIPNTFADRKFHDSFQSPSPEYNVFLLKRMKGVIYSLTKFGSPDKYPQLAKDLTKTLIELRHCHLKDPHTDVVLLPLLECAVAWNMNGLVCGNLLTH